MSNESTAAETSSPENNSAFLGTEKISKLMLKFCIPCVLSLLVSALYNIVDQIFVGNSELGDTGNGAAGVVFPIFIIAQAFAWWFGDGCAAFLNICQGKKDDKNAHKSIGTGLVITITVSLILMAVFYPLKTQLLTLFGATEDGVNAYTGAFEVGTLNYAVEYFNIILGFFPVFMAMNMMNVYTVKRVKKTYLNILICTLAVGIISTILFEACPTAIVSIFGGPKNCDADLYWDFATKLFRIFLMLVTFTCAIKMTSIFFQAVGKPVFAVIASLIRDIICFVPLICVLPVFYGIEGILWAAPAADLIAMIVAAALTIVYFKK